MAEQMTKKDRITQKAKQLLGDAPEGLRFSELVAALREAFPGEAYGNLTGSIWNLDNRFPEEIEKPSRGLFRSLKFREVTEPVAPTVTNERRSPPRSSEDAFYQPFSQWLIDLEECTRAVPLGGNRFKKKWGTPDVYGIYKSRESDLVRTLEVIVAEIKTDGSELVTAFGHVRAARHEPDPFYLNKHLKDMASALDL